MRVMLKKKWTLQKIIMLLQLVVCPISGVCLLIWRNWNTMPAPWIFNIALDLLGMYICLLLFMSVVKDRADVTLRTGCFAYLISICGMELFLDLLCWIVDEIPYLRVINFGVNTVSFALSNLLLCITWYYLVEVSESENPLLDQMSKVINIGGVVAFLGIIGNIFGHYYFNVDSSGTYYRTTFFPLCYLYTLVMVVVVFRMIMKMDVTPDKKRVLLSFVVLPLVGIVVQSLAFGVALTYPGYLCSLIFIYSNVFSEQKRELIAQNLKVMRAENELLLSQQKNARIEAELNMATEIQSKILPMVFPDIKGIDLYATMHPAKEVGGDFYDFFQLDDDHMALVIADVSGKGVPAALYMMIAKTMIKSTAKQMLSPAKICEVVNRQLCESAEEVKMFVTVWIGIYDIATHKLTVANAGHEYPAIRRKNGLFELYKDKHSFVIGGMDGIPYKEYELELQPGDTLFVYTDGVTEACSEDQILFGTDRMIQTLNQQPDADAKQLIAEMNQALQEYIGAEDQFDDITMMTLRIEDEKDDKKESEVNA